MINVVKAFSGFSVDDLSKAKQFYSSVLGLQVDDDEMGLMLRLPGDGRVFVYEKETHRPATYTALNFQVDDIDSAVDELVGKGITFERYEGMPADEKGVVRGIAANRGPDIAWFRDPAGNILSVLQEK